MIGTLAPLILLGSVSLTWSADTPVHLSVTVVKPGDNVTLSCPVSDKEGKFFHLYKQSLGFMAQKVASGILGIITVIEEFKVSRYSLTKERDEYFFTIRNVSKNDEATYFCQNGTAYTQTFSSGTFLAVNDVNQHKSVYAKQSPKAESVQSGDSVTLHCSLQSKNKKNRVQCPDELSVYWFRSGPGGFNPGVIYTQNNREEEEDKSCSYSLSKTIQSSSDAGTYYCAVLTCGHILFGEGTNVETRPGLDPVVLVLGLLLTCCVSVITAFVFYVRRIKVCDHCKGTPGTTSASHHHGKQRKTINGSNDVGDAAEVMNYLALNSPTRSHKKVKNRESPHDCVYSSVEYRGVDQQIHQ